MKDYHFPQALLDVLEQDIFTFVTEEYMPWECDGISLKPSAHFVIVDFDRLGQGGERYEAAVREYARIRDAVLAEKAVRHQLGVYLLIPGLDLDALHKVNNWEEKYAYFVLTEAQLADFEEWNTPEFSAFCAANDIKYVIPRGDHIHDLTAGCDFVIHREYVPGSADDAATYLEYHFREVPQE